VRAGCAGMVGIAPSKILVDEIVAAMKSNLKYFHNEANKVYPSNVDTLESYVVFPVYQGRGRTGPATFVTVFIVSATRTHLCGELHDNLLFQSIHRLLLLNAEEGVI
jgi:hypothetical protein